MTLEHLQSLSNEELNELAAVKVMGWRSKTIDGKTIYMDIDGMGGFWNPTEDMNDAWQMLDQFRSKNSWIGVDTFGEKDFRCIIDLNHKSIFVESVADAAPKAVTIAAILAKGE